LPGVSSYSIWEWRLRLDIKYSQRPTATTASPYVRGFTLVNTVTGYATTPEHIVAHELAHVFLDSADEKKVDNQAQIWMKAAKVEVAVMGGAR
jgi:hypothetical protein